MSLFVIADLHLSSDGLKSMDVFGSRWKDYMKKIEKNWTAVVAPEDTVIIPGDVSWGLRIEDALEDFLFLERLPGKKLIGKGNHDFWWSSVTKIRAFFEAHDLHSIDLLFNNAYLLENCIVSGTRGWFMEEYVPDAIAERVDHDKIAKRECGRLRLSLEAAAKLREEDGRGLPILTFLHFPPVWNDFICRDLIDILHEFDVKTCYFGHIHGTYQLPGIFTFENVQFIMCSADYLNFAPKPVQVT